MLPTSSTRLLRYGVSRRQVPSILVPSTESMASLVPAEPSSATDLARVVALPSSELSARELGSRTVAPCLVVVLSTSSAVEVPPPLVLCRWTTITSRFWAPAAVAALPDVPSEDRPGSLPAYQR